MSAKKREADSQITKDGQELDDSDDGDESSNTGTWRTADAQTLATRRIVKARIKPLQTESTGTTASPFAALSAGLLSQQSNSMNTSDSKTIAGFSQYAKSNPFATVASSSTFLKPPPHSIITEFSDPTSSSKTFAGVGKLSSFGATLATFNTNSEGVAKANPPPALTIPSPKSPKVNPFSNPSPVQNPFMSIHDESQKDPYTTIVDCSGSVPSTDEPSSASSVSYTPLVESAAEASTAAAGTGEAKSVQDDDRSRTFGAGGGGSIGDSKLSTGSSPRAYGKVYQLQENVVVVTGEEGEDCILQLRAKLFRLVQAVAASVTPPSVEKFLNPATESETPAVASIVSSEVAGNTDSGANELSSPSSSSSSSSSSFSSSSDSSSADAGIAVASSSSPSVSAATATSSWSEVGVGPVKVLKSVNPATGAAATYRLVMRREVKAHGIGTKLLLNVALKKHVGVSKAAEKNMFCFTCFCPKDEVSQELVFSTFLFKTKLVQECDQLYAAIESAKADADDSSSRASLIEVQPDRKEISGAI